MKKKIPTFPDTGKINDKFFKTLIYPYCGSNRKEVVRGPEYGVDISIINLPNGLEMALTSDPLTLIPTLGLKESAWLSVHLMANDMATTGVAPMYAQFVLNLPPALSPEDFEIYWRHIHTFCKDIGVAITGGHTGRFEEQNSTVAGGGTMIAIAQQGVMLTSKGANPDDVVIVTKESALIATSVLALSFPETVKNSCGTEIYHRACDLFYETSALQAGLIAGEQNTKDNMFVTAMHDVTEGGILGAIYELALASGCGVYIESDLLPIGEAQKQICKLFDIDPRYSVGAGSMIIAVKKEKADAILQTLHSKGIKASAVGKLVNKEQGLIIKENEKEKPLCHPGADPYWKAFYSAIQKGLK